MAIGDRLLVFSQSLFTLTLLEEFLQQRAIPAVLLLVFSTASGLKSSRRTPPVFVPGLESRSRDRDEDSGPVLNDVGKDSGDMPVASVARFRLLSGTLFAAFMPVCAAGEAAHKGRPRRLDMYVIMYDVWWLMGDGFRILPEGGWRTGGRPCHGSPRWA